MKKRLFGLILAAILLFSAAACAQSETDDTRVFDYAGLFSAEEAETLNAAIADFQQNTGYDFAIMITYEDLGEVDYQQFCNALYTSQSLGLGMNHTAMVCYLDLYGDGYYYITPYGDFINIMGQDDFKFLAEYGMEYFTKGDFAGGFTQTMNILAEALSTMGTKHPDIRVYDYAEILSDKETETLEAAIADFRALSGIDFLFLSTYEGMTGNEDGDYMSEFFNVHGFGDGDSRSGVMFYLDLYSGSYYVQNFGGIDGIVPQEDLNVIVSDAEEMMMNRELLPAVLYVIEAYSAYFR